MEGAKEKPHIIKYSQHISLVVLVMCFTIILCGLAGLSYPEYLPVEVSQLWWQNLMFIFLIVAGFVWLIFGLQSCKTVFCDTHKQEVVYKPLLGTQIKIPFTEVYKIQIWPKSTDIPEKTIDREGLLEVSLDKVKFIGKQGVFISAEKTNKFNHVIYNFLEKVPLEVKTSRK